MCDPGLQDVLIYEPVNISLVIPTAKPPRYRDIVYASKSGPQRTCPALWWRGTTADRTSNGSSSTFTYTMTSASVSAPSPNHAMVVMSMTLGTAMSCSSPSPHSPLVALFIRLRPN